MKEISDNLNLVKLTFEKNNYNETLFQNLFEKGNKEKVIKIVFEKKNKEIIIE